jgi:hypothetical protein
MDIDIWGKNCNPPSKSARVFTLTPNIPKGQLAAAKLMLTHIVTHLQCHGGKHLCMVSAWARHALGHHVTVADGFDLLQPILLDQ